MAELTDQEIQEMIQKAREGDAEANFRMSEWALEQAMEEPEEERWNRLAAKCLVKSAEAGYQPAKERMDELIRQLEDEQNASSPQVSEEIPESRETFDEEPAPTQPPVRKAPSPSAEPRQAAFSLEKLKSGAAAVFAKVSAFVADLFKKPTQSEDGGDGEPTSRTRAAAKHTAGLAAMFRFSEWTDTQWKKAQRICLIVCIVLVLLIIIMVFSGRGKKEAEPEETPAIPAAATAEPVQPTATPEVVLYPDAAVRSAIESANLDVAPADTDYVTEATTATVKTNGSVLNMRRGTASTYGQIGTIPNGTEVDVYAYKSNWALVSYNGAYGWCSTEYLK